MLPHEIEPFADHHIEELEAVQNLLIEIRKDDTIDVPDAYIAAALNRLGSAKQAFYRFKVCMADEVKQKEQLRKKALDCRLHHK